MRIGVMVPMSVSDGPGRTPSWSDVSALARHAESAGLDSVWVCDHLISEPPGQPPEGLLEGWTTLAALAATTQRVSVGTLVTCTAFRHPALLAKMAATVDGISGGRLVLGLGAGFPGLEYRMYGFPDDHRLARFEEALTVIGGLLHGGGTVGGSVTTTGRFHRLRDAALLPPPQRPIPLLVAGAGPQMLRLTARHAHAWNTAWYGAPDDQLHTQLAAMARALADEGRDPASLHVTVGMSETGPAAPDDLAQVLDAYARLDVDELGVDELIVGLTPLTERSVDRVAEAIRRRTGE